MSRPSSRDQISCGCDVCGNHHDLARPLKALLEEDCSKLSLVEILHKLRTNPKTKQNTIRFKQFHTEKILLSSTTTTTRNGKTKTKKKIKRVTTRRTYQMSILDDDLGERVENDDIKYTVHKLIRDMAKENIPKLMKAFNVIIEVDWSENTSTQSGTESQACHMNRESITLHVTETTQDKAVLFE